MRSLPFLFAVPLVAACSATSLPVPSLAPRAAEAIDPRLPIADEPAPGILDPALAGRLSSLVAEVRSGVPAFEAREAEAGRLATAAGPVASESWIAAQLALTKLVEQYGVTTRAAADIDALVAQRLETQRWIAPADRQAIAAAAAEVAAISDRQAAAIERIGSQLAR